ncbi:MAG: hypothetical protein AB1586_25655 [Pseudomonadota bacterium]
MNVRHPSVRIERDSIGLVEVPADALYGAPVMAYNILTSIDLLTRGCDALAEILAEVDGAAHE